MKKKKSNWTKVVALILVAAMVLGVVAASIFAAFSGGPSYTGTYKSGSGSTIVLRSDGSATVTLPGVNGPQQFLYSVNGNEVIFTSSSSGGTVTLQIKGKNLTLSQGGQTETWVKQ
jgi:hypothetical protein